MILNLNFSKQFSTVIYLKIQPFLVSYNNYSKDMNYLRDMEKYLRQFPKLKYLTLYRYHIDIIFSFPILESIKDRNIKINFV